MTKKYTKEEIEMALGDKFLELYNKSHDTNFTPIRNGVQGVEADIICSNNLQIEVVSNHYSQDIKEASVYQMEHAGIFKSGILFEQDENALSFLLESLEEKNKKLLKGFYGKQKMTFLLIDLRENCLTTMLDFSNLIKEKRLNVQIEFDQVWLFHYRFIISGTDLPDSALYDDDYCIWNFYKK